MTTFSIHLRLIVETGADDDAFDAHTDAVYEALLDMDGIFDADMSASITARTVSFSVFVEDDTTQAALNIAMGAVRTAIHVAGGYTPGWEKALDQASADVSPTPVLV